MVIPRTGYTRTCEWYKNGIRMVIQERVGEQRMANKNQMAEVCKTKKKGIGPKMSCLYDVLEDLRRMYRELSYANCIVSIANGVCQHVQNIVENQCSFTSTITKIKNLLTTVISEITILSVGKKVSSIPIHCI